MKFVHCGCVHACAVHVFCMCCACAVHVWTLKHIESQRQCPTVGVHLCKSLLKVNHLIARKKTSRMFEALLKIARPAWP